MSGRNALTQSLTNILRIKGDNMNNVIMIGRLTTDPALRFIAGSGKAVANFTLAVNREFSKTKEADFFKVIIWDKQAENVANFLHKGSQVAVKGSLRNNNYETANGEKRYTVEIQADRVEFLDSKKEGTQPPRDKPEPQTDSGLGFGEFQEIEDDDSIPF